MKEQKDVTKKQKNSKKIQNTVDNSSNISLSSNNNIIDKDLRLDAVPLSEKIATLLSNMILEGEIKPGTKLTEVALSNQFGFSRTPIREALRILEREGFVEITPRKGTVVTTLTEKDVIDIFTLKYKLEAMAASLASEHINKKDIMYLESLNKEILSLIESKNIPKLIEINSKLHFFIINKCGNTRLIKILNDITTQFNRATAISYNDEKRIKEIVEEHRKIIEALKQKDDKLIEKTLEEHIQNGWKYIKRNFQNMG